jgi:hypothetical protein
VLHTGETWPIILHENIWCVINRVSLAVQQSATSHGFVPWEPIAPIATIATLDIVEWEPLMLRQ